MSTWSQCPSDMKQEKGRCVWFGQCQESPGKPGDMLNCYYNGPAKDPKEEDETGEFYKLLVDTCPQYAHTNVCCNVDQLSALATQIKYPQQLFSRCPACLKNFMDHFCATTCDPDQALFIEPMLCMPGQGEHENQTVIYSVNVYTSQDYAEDLYGSCSNVQYPQGSSRVVDLMCGATSNCNASLWLGFMGSSELNSYTPFDMYYKIGVKPPPNFISREYDFISCNTTDPHYQCSCADCDAPDLCPVPDLPKPSNFPRRFVQFSIIGVGMFLSVVLSLAGLAYGLYLVLMNGESSYLSIVPGYAPIGAVYKSLGNDSPTSSVGSVNVADVNLKDVQSKPPQTTHCISGAHLENYIKIIFYNWGLFVAKCWYLVIGVGVGLILVIAGLTVTLHFTGTVPFLITTDPVKLWSAPTSRARQEKDYFDEHFGPFYRSEMIIITAPNKNSSTIVPLNVVGGGAITFGPVFDRDVILEVSCGGWLDEDSAGTGGQKSLLCVAVQDSVLPAKHGRPLHHGEWHGGGSDTE